MSALDAQLDRELSGEGEEAATSDDSKAEERRAKDRERKRRSREAQTGTGEPKRKPGRPRKDAGATEKKEPDLDPRVVLAVKMCVASMLEPNVTPEFVEQMNAAFQGALAYELEERLSLLADGYEPEVGLGCAILGAGITRFRHDRWKKKQGTIVVEAQPVPDGETPDAGKAA